MRHSSYLIRWICLAAALTILGPLAVGPAWSTAQRTFVASYGLAANTAFNCSLAMPCRAFNEAISVTNPGGEVVILDTAGYGAMTINKTIKIIGPAGVYGGISVIGAGGPTTGIVINAGVNDVVTLRGLDVSGVPGAAPLPLHGIDIQSAGAVHIEKTSVSNFTQNASECIRMSTGVQAALFIVDSFLRECATGVRVEGTASGPNPPVATIDNTRIERGANTQSGLPIVGVRTAGNYLVNIRNSQITTGLIGVFASQTTITDNPSVTIADSQISLMGTAAILTGPGPGTPGTGPLRVNIQRSTINASLAAIKHNYGTVRLSNNVLSNVTHMFVNCGSDQFWGPSIGTDSTGASPVLYGTNFATDFANPGAGAVGCVTYNSPGKIIAQ